MRAKLAITMGSEHHPQRENTAESPKRRWPPNDGCRQSSGACSMIGWVAARCVTLIWPRRRPTAGAAICAEVLDHRPLDMTSGVSTVGADLAGDGHTRSHLLGG